jgi:hypothetical protein
VLLARHQILRDGRTGRRRGSFEQRG